MVVGHVGAIHRYSAKPHGGRNRRLRHPTLAQQYYLDALALLRRHLPPQCRFQSPDLALAAFDICSLESDAQQGITEIA